LARYPVKHLPTVDDEVVHLLHYAMIEVVREGTGKAVYRYLPEDYAVAGKTGSTNDLRDSWFAGFAGDYLAVVWLGRDDNGSTGLTGSSGALKVWGEFMASASHQPLGLEAPEGVVYQWIDNDSGLLSGRLCENARYMPFIQGSAPQHKAKCSGTIPGVFRWFQNLFD
jgi:penicillin-binding protein 1B